MYSTVRVCCVAVNVVQGWCLKTPEPELGCTQGARFCVWKVALPTLDFARSIDEALEFSEGVAPIWKVRSNDEALELAGTTYHGRSFLPAAHSSWKLRYEGDV